MKKKGDYLEFELEGKDGAYILRLERGNALAVMQELWDAEYYPAIETTNATIAKAIAYLRSYADGKETELRLDVGDTIYYLRYLEKLIKYPQFPESE